jgi:atrophin-1 interacting protein 3 (BAI1-associated protein 1)
MGEAGLCGQVTMILRRKIQRSQSTIKYPYDVIVTRNENEGFGFVVISSSTAQPNGLAIIGKPKSTCLPKNLITFFLWLPVSFKIGKLIPGSPAERCGDLKIGDRIIAVNNIDITLIGMSHGDVVNLIKESGLQVKLTIGNPTILIQSTIPNSNRPPILGNGNANNNFNNISANNINNNTNNSRNGGLRLPIIS